MFRLRLALALGKLPGEIDAMPYSDYADFKRFYDIEPWGLPMHDAMNAWSMSLLANTNRNSERRPEPFRMEDFLLFSHPEKDVPKEEPTVEGKTAAQWKLIFAAEALQTAQKQRKDKEVQPLPAVAV